MKRSKLMLPKLLARKLYKTGQTRGADDDEIYQNRVLRSSTVLIPYSCWDLCKYTYENGFIVLLTPEEYFDNPNIKSELKTKGLAIGKNALVFFESRAQWNAHNPIAMNWKAADRRTNPLGGQYVARIPANTSTSGGKIVQGFSTTTMKGAGIRVYEYASAKSIAECRLQLEALFWMCRDALDVLIENGMSRAEAVALKKSRLDECHVGGLLDYIKLTNARLVDTARNTICPLCLDELSAQGFFNRMKQAEGRAVLDLTVTELNLFHITELRVGTLNHCAYNLGWGHHHCNVVVKDVGIAKTIEWMRSVLQRNRVI